MGQGRGWGRSGTCSCNLDLPMERYCRTTATAAEFKQVEGKLNSNCYCSGSKAKGRKHSPFVLKIDTYVNIQQYLL